MAFEWFHPIIDGNAVCIFWREKCIIECFIVYRVIGNDGTNVVFGFLYNTKNK